MEVYVARQPIFNSSEEIIAYELLYRNKNKNVFPNIDSDSATVNVLVNSFLSIGIEEVSKGKPTFVNFSSYLLQSPVFDFISPGMIVIEVLEDVVITNEILSQLKHLKSRGFKIALDDFVLTEDKKNNYELFQCIDYIKIDFLALSLLKRMEYENFFKENYPHIKLLAEKVETREQFEVAKHSGYELFQGYFFEHPQIIQSTDIPPNAIQYLQILSHLRKDEPDINLLAESIERDISLTYKLLQLINHSSKKSKTKVRTIKQAVLLLGLTELRKWMYLLALREARLDIEKETKKEIIYMSFFRGKMCEKLANYKLKENASEFFLIGLFSLIDALLERSLDVILQQLPFPDDIIDTIKGKDTEMSPYLKLSSAVSKGDWKKIEMHSEQLCIPTEIIMNFCEEAKEWVKEFIDY